MAEEKREFVEKFKKNVKSRRLTELIADASEISVNVLGVLSPENYDEVKRRWLAGARRGVFSDPVFVYDRDRAEGALSCVGELNDLLEKAKSFSPATLEEAYLQQMLILRIESKMASVGILREFVKGDSPDLRAAVIKKYGRPNVDDAKAAEKLLRGPTPIILFDEQVVELQKLTLDARQVKACFNWVLEQYGLSFAYDVILNSEAQFVSVKHPAGIASGRIKIPAWREFDGVEVLRLVGHEIESHIIEEQNTRNILYGMPRVGNELISEGRALQSDVEIEQHFLGDTPILRDKARLIVLVSMALRGKSFAELAEWVYGSLRREGGQRDPHETAWTLTYRVMRGISDGRNPYGYAFTKEYSYYAGYRMLESRPDDELAWFASGLARTDEVDVLKNYYCLTEDDLPWKSLGLAWSEALREEIIAIAAARLSNS